MKTVFVRRKLLSCLAVIIILSMLGACGQATATTAPTAQPQVIKETVVVQNTVEVTQVVAPTAAPTATKPANMIYGLPRDQTFVIGYDSGSNSGPAYDQFNPLLPSFNNGTEAEGVVLEPAIVRDMIQTNLITYYSATGWKYNSDYTEMTLTVRDDANWNDGQPLTMADWEFTIKYLMDNAAKLAVGQTLKTNIASFTDDGKTTLTFKLTKPNPRFNETFINNMGIPLPKHIYDGQDPLVFTNPNAVGAGPFKMQSCSNDTKTCIYVRRDDYYDKDHMPAMKYLVATQAPAPDLYIQEWVKGNFDFGMRQLPEIQAVMAANPNVKRFDAPDPCPRDIAMNEEVKPLDDVQFRAALNLLLDRNKTANGDSTPGQVQIVPWPYQGTPATTFFNQSDADQYEVVKFDPTEAAKILDAAGYKLVNGKRLDKDGKPIILSAISMLPENVAWTLGLVLIEQEASKLGIEIDVRVLDPGTLMDDFSKGNYDLSFYWQCPVPNDPWSVYEQLLPEHYVKSGQSSNGLNVFRYKAPDDLITAINTILAGSPDDPTVQSAYKQAYAIVMRDHVWISEYSQMYSFAENTEYWTGLVDAKLYNYWNPQMRLLLDAIKPAQ